MDQKKWPETPKTVFNNLLKHEKPVSDKEYEEFINYYLIKEEFLVEYSIDPLKRYFFPIPKDLRVKYDHRLKNIKREHLERNPKYIEKGENK